MFIFNFFCGSDSGGGSGAFFVEIRADTAACVCANDAPEARKDVVDSHAGKNRMASTGVSTPGFSSQRRDENPEKKEAPKSLCGSHATISNEKAILYGGRGERNSWTISRWMRRVL